MQSVGERAFFRCEALESVSIANPAIKIEKYAFSGCIKLSEVNLPKGLSWSKVKGKFINTPWGEKEPLLTEEKQAKKQTKKEKSGPVTEESLLAIVQEIFPDCENKSSYVFGALKIDVKLSNECIILGNYAINKRKGLDQIDWKFLRNIKEQADICHEPLTLFLVGDKLMPISLTTTHKNFQSVRFHLESINNITRFAFKGCTSLKKVVLPDGITIIEEQAFFGCSSLESVEIPDTVTRIERLAFGNCSSLKSIEIPNSVKEIDEQAFVGTAVELPA